jgi:Spy/CpxP family protein refolding chaperone
MRRGMRALLMRDITLSDAQRAQIRTIRERHRAQQQALREEVRGRWRGRRDGAAATRPDSATRVARRAEFEAFRGRVRDLRQRQLADIRAVLTPAQQASFDRNVAELRARGAERAARRGQRAPGQEPGRRPARGQRGPGGSPGGTVRGGAPGGF